MRIGRYLDHQNACIDSVADKTHHAISLLQEYRTALISAAVTIQIDVREDAA